MSPLPVTVIGGALGAGKTTILNQLLRNADRRLAVLVNDFGSVNLDAELIARQSDDVIELTNGCICCAIADGLVMALMGILDRPTLPEHLVIETSGVANPAAVANYAGLPGFELDGVLVAVDGEQFLSQLNDKYIGEITADQVRAADVILLAKADLVDDLTPVISRLGELAPGVPVQTTVDGLVDPALVYSPSLVGQRSSSSHALDAISAERSLPERDKTAIAEWLDDAPTGVIRVKGYAGTASGRIRFDRVGPRVTIRPDTEASIAARAQVVVIAQPGTEIDSWLDLID